MMDDYIKNGVCFERYNLDERSIALDNVKELNELKKEAENTVAFA